MYKVDIDAILDEQVMPLHQIMNLEVGQTVMLGATPDSRIELRCGGGAAAQPAAWAGWSSVATYASMPPLNVRMPPRRFNREEICDDPDFLRRSRAGSCWPPRFAIASVLERRLAAIARGGRPVAPRQLNMAIAGAGASLRALKSAAGEAAVTLDDRLKRARLHIDELTVLTASGERIADRIEGAAMRADASLPLRTGRWAISTCRPAAS